ncbi:MAG TPA: hypothetical protein VHW23_11070, partial [Kofleriaceae bacterium]|nr:hypothetical protein [Kofleriaceae bacterium]
PGGDAGGFPDAFPGGDAGGFPDAFPGGGDAGGFPDGFPGGDALPGSDAGGGEGPSARFTDVPPRQSNAATASFGFFSNDPTATFACELDVGGFVPCSSPHVLASVTDGPHTLTLRATGAGGISTLVPYSWVVDTTPPTLTIIVGPSDVSNVTRPTFVFTLSEAIIFSQCDVDGSGFFICSSPHTLDPLADGPHTFTVRATDLVGNIGFTHLSWTIDTSGLAPGG